MIYALLIRYGLWAACIAAFSLVVYFVSSYFYNLIFEDGRLAERAEWQEKAINYQSELSKAVNAAAQAMRDDQDKQVNGLLKAIKNESKAKLDLEKQLNNERVANRGLWISAKACSGSADGTAKKDQGASISGSGANRIRLPDQIESDLRELAADAQRVVIQYETARSLVMSCPSIEIVPNQ